MTDVNSNHTELPMVAVIHKEDEANRKPRAINRSDEDIEDASESVIIEDEVDAGESAAAQERSDNSYAAKKTVAQGMMDIALITANANQLRFLTQFTSNHTVSYFVNVSLIIISLLLQVAIGVCLIFKGRLDFKGMSKKRTAKVINNYVVIGVFLVTIINVFIASFAVGDNQNNDDQQRKGMV